MGKLLNANYYSMTIRFVRILFLVALTVQKGFAQLDIERQYSKLLEDVQLKGVFADSKTFPACTPRFPVATIVSNYEQKRQQRNFDLKSFVDQNFIVPVQASVPLTRDPDASVQKSLEDQWKFFVRQPVPAKQQGQSTLIPLLKPYMALDAGGEDLGYWQSVFTMMGLHAAGVTQVAMVRNMADNFSYLINRYGYVPAGNRTYYLSRSQPPVYALMVNLLTEVQGRRSLINYLPALQKEYDYWMAGKEKLAQNGQADRRVVRLSSTIYLNRYFDDRDTPRPEAYREDVAVARQRAGLFKKGRPEAEIYRDIRAAAESGWEGSSRWLKDGKTPRSIQTTNVIPVDLNCLLFHLEVTLSDAYRLKGNKKLAQQYLELARQRYNAIQRYCWNPRRAFFCDYDLTTQKSTPVSSLAAVYPLAFRAATREQAQQVAAALKRDFLKPGGLVTSLTVSGQPWDAPYAWAGLQWLAIRGLRQYGESALADQIKLNWISDNLRVFKANGYLMPKNNLVSQLNTPVSTVPYAPSNGVLLWMLKNN
nr:trehalase family glycosidase [uncultured Arsenicibacter sp.]